MIGSFLLVQSKFYSTLTVGTKEKRSHEIGNHLFRGMVFNATFNNISVISWRSDSLVEETGVLGENPQPVISH